MRRSSYIFTSESVSEGHPDKVADRISDTVVDAFLAADPVARVACETMVTTNRIILSGEVRGPQEVIESLEAEASTVAFPEGFRQMRKDMENVQRRLKSSDVGTETQGIEQDIIDNLKDMIEDVRKH